jgi:uncharacterized alpha-E superfamily protein
VLTGPGPSIRTSIVEARRQAQSVRPSLSSEVYEALNELHWRIQATDGRGGLHEFLISVERGVQLVWGLVDDTMTHDEAWDFILLGKHLERAVAVTRLVTQRLEELTQEGDDPVEWGAVLRCCSAFEAYRWRFSAPVTPRRVAGFLLLDHTLPRSAEYAISVALEAVRRIDGGGQSPPHRLLGRLAGLFNYTTEEEVAGDPAGFARSFATTQTSLESALQASYFRPSQVAEEAPVVPAAWVQPQQ